MAFLSIASGLAKLGETVTFAGSGPPRPDSPYRYIQLPTIPRERFESFPKFVMFRNETAWEDAIFAARSVMAIDPSEQDVTITCAFPFTHFALRRPALGKRRAPHVFVTQNGDWPAFSRSAEYRLFDCDGLVCINPLYFERNRDRYRSALIPNGVDTARFTPGPAERHRFGLPDDVPVVLMASALIASKNVGLGIEAVARTASAHLVIAGDGPLRGPLEALAAKLLPGRFSRISVAADDMPALYRSCDALLHLSEDESFGNVYVEALACGKPVVAPDIAHTRWILGNAGTFVDSMEAGAIADGLTTSLEQPNDPAMLVKRASEFDWSKIAASYQAFLAEVVEKSG